MIFSDFHAHTTFCDGKNTPEEMIISAINKGLKNLGLVIHSYTYFYPSGSCKSVEHEVDFANEMNRLKKKYADKINVTCGIEMDFYSAHKPTCFDYVIGSVHFFEANGKYYPIDSSAEKLDFAVNEAFGGDYMSAAEDYFNNVKMVVEKHNADIIGHFDLITKFNEVHPKFDVNNPRYVKAWKDAVDYLVKFDKPFEINTGAISRGYRTTPYPAQDMIEYIKKKGGKFMLSSDSHSAENLAFQYSEWKKLL